MKVLLLLLDQSLRNMEGAFGCCDRHQVIGLDRQVTQVHENKDYNQYAQQILEKAEIYIRKHDIKERSDYDLTDFAGIREHATDLLKKQTKQTSICTSTPHYATAQAMEGFKVKLAILFCAILTVFYWATYHITLNLFSTVLATHNNMIIELTRKHDYAMAELQAEHRETAAELVLLKAQVEMLMAHFAADMSGTTAENARLCAKVEEVEMALEDTKLQCEHQDNSKTELYKDFKNINDFDLLSSFATQKQITSMNDGENNFDNDFMKDSSPMNTNNKEKINIYGERHSTFLTSILHIIKAEGYGSIFTYVNSMLFTGEHDVFYRLYNGIKLLARGHILPFSWFVYTYNKGLPDPEPPPDYGEKGYFLDFILH